MPEVTADTGFRPKPHQRAAHALLNTARFLVLVWHRRAGKTVFAIVELIRSAMANKRSDGRYAYLAPLLKQAKAVAWDYLKLYTRGIPGCVYNESDLSVTFPHGARIRLFGADNEDSLRGLFFDGIVLDEVADMKERVWGEVIRPALSDKRGWAIFIGTPKGLNLFSRLYQDATNGLPDWAADMQRAGQTGMIEANEIESSRQSMSPAQFAQEFDCDFSAAAANALIPIDVAYAARRRTVAASAYEPYPRIMGVDIARQGEDSCAIAWRQGPVANQIEKLRGDDSMVFADQLAMRIEKVRPDAVFVDLGSMGGAVCDRMRQLGFTVMGVDFGARALDPAHFQNRRVEMYWLLAEWVKLGGCLPDDDELQDELCAHQFSYDNAPGRLSLMSKDDVRELLRGHRSPDKSDALALTFAAPVAIRTEYDRAFAAQKRTWDYDPYARTA